MTKINVAIVDDNEKMVSLLDAILQTDKNIEVIGRGTMVFRHWTLLRIRSRMLSFWI